MREDEEGAVIRTAEDEIDGALRDVDATDELAIWTVAERAAVVSAVRVIQNSREMFRIAPIPNMDTIV